jgi:hypothetical protein
MLVAPGDLAAFESALRALLGESPRRRQLGETARRHVLERYGIPCFVEGLTKVYDDLLEGGARRGGRGSAVAENHA